MVDSVKAGYRGREVLRGVSFTLERGEKMVIIGPNGSGKSTLLKVLLRLVEPWSGRIVFDGVNLTKLGDGELRRVRSRMAYLPQHHGLFPHMKVLDNVAFPLVAVKGLPREEARKVALRHLALMGVEDLAERYPLQLSGGQQQRVALARALSMDAELLLLDEPTSALDPESRAEVLDALKSVARMGKSMILVTHEIGFALEVADKLAYIEDGRLLAVGEPHDVLSNPRARRFVYMIRTG